MGVLRPALSQVSTVIAVLETLLADYRIPVFRRLAERLSDDLTVYHVPPAAGTDLRFVADDDVGFRRRAVSARWLFGSRVLLANPMRVLEEDPRAIVVRHQHLLSNPLSPLLLAACRWRGIPLIVWGHGYSRRRPFEPAWIRPRDRIHLALIRFCDAYLCYTDEIRQNLARYVDDRKLFVARNTLDSDRLFALRRQLESKGRTAVREELGLNPGATYLCYIGRLHERKRLLVLLEAAARLRATGQGEIEVLLVGDGPMRGELENAAAELGLAEHVVFAGARYEEAAARYLFASDLLTLPGWLGLAVVHALSLGVPVVSQRLGPGLVGHPPEAAFVHDGVNGYMAEAGGSLEFASAIERALDDRQALVEGAIGFAEANLTLDGMVDGFLAAIDYVSERVDE